jgi:hypothetical protein
VSGKSISQPMLVSVPHHCAPNIPLAALNADFAPPPQQAAPPPPKSRSTATPLPSEDPSILAQYTRNNSDGALEPNPTASPLVIAASTSPATRAAPARAKSPRAVVQPTTPVTQGIKPSQASEIKAAARMASSESPGAVQPARSLPPFQRPTKPRGSKFTSLPGRPSAPRSTAQNSTRASFSTGRIATASPPPPPSPPPSPSPSPSPIPKATTTTDQLQSPPICQTNLTGAGAGTGAGTGTGTGTGTPNPFLKTSSTPALNRTAGTLAVAATPPRPLSPPAPPPRRDRTIKRNGSAPPSPSNTQQANAIGGAGGGILRKPRPMPQSRSTSDVRPSKFARPPQTTPAAAATPASPRHVAETTPCASATATFNRIAIPSIEDTSTQTLATPTWSDEESTEYDESFQQRLRPLSVILFAKLVPEERRPRATAIAAADDAYYNNFQDV